MKALCLNQGPEGVETEVTRQYNDVRFITTFRTRYFSYLEVLILACALSNMETIVGLFLAMRGIGIGYY